MQHQALNQKHQGCLCVSSEVLFAPPAHPYFSDVRLGLLCLTISVALSDQF